MTPGEETKAPETGAQVIEQLFTYHAPTDDTRRKYEAIRNGAKALALIIDHACPPGPDRTHAIRQLRECVMTANAAIATGGAAYR